MNRASKRSAGGNLGIYRHFAVATVAITGVLAMFTGGNGAVVAPAQGTTGAPIAAPGPDKVDLAIAGKGTNEIHDKSDHSWTYVDTMGQSDNMVVNTSSVEQLGSEFNSYLDGAGTMAGSVSDEVVRRINQSGISEGEVKRRRVEQVLQDKDKATADGIARMIAQSRARAGAGE